MLPFIIIDYDYFCAHIYFIIFMYSFRAKLIAIITICFFYHTKTQVDIGITQVNSSAILEVTSNNKGFLPPRLTTEQRNAISNPHTGLLIYNTTYNCIQYYGSGACYDPCYKNTVTNRISGFSFLTQIDLTVSNVFTKINSADGSSAGVTATDGEYVYSATSTMTIDKLKLFANRKGNSGVQSDISELSIFSPALSASEQETMNQYLLCKYGD